jgi:cardiolipin synthase
VRVLVPVASDSLLADLASRASFARLLKAGIRLFQHNPVAHSKALLVDRDFVSVGSYNFDHRSLVYNLELVVNALDRDCNQALAAVLEEDMAAGTEIRWEHFRRRPLSRRILERLAYGLRHWL